MNEYKKRLAGQGSQKQNSETAAPQGINGIPNSVLNDVFAGKRRATNEMMGHRVDPAPSVMARMSQAFGMDFSNVQVYRSDAMSGTGMHGMAQGNKVVLGSDVDLNTQEGQAVLGHEFSHIRAQSMGIGTGSGLLRDAGLEHQADNEGLLAARGMSISGESMGMTTGLGMAGFEGLTPLGGGMSATAAAPMQADGWKDSVSDFLGFGRGALFRDVDEMSKLGAAQGYLQSTGKKEDAALVTNESGPFNIMSARHLQQFKNLGKHNTKALEKYLAVKQTTVRKNLQKKHDKLKLQAPMDSTDQQRQDYADYLLLRDSDEVDAFDGFDAYKQALQFVLDEGYDENFIANFGDSTAKEMVKRGVDFEKSARMDNVLFTRVKAMGGLRKKFADLTGQNEDDLLGEEETILSRKAEDARKRLTPQKKK